MALTKPNTFIDDTDIDAAPMNDNFDAIYNAVGDQEFANQNYISNNEDVTKSLEVLDAQVAANAAASGGASASTAYTEQSSVPATVSNQGRVLAMEGTNNSETIPIFARENDGGAMTLLMGDASHKQWVYRNTATPGWVIDSSVTDRVIAVKGGSGSYNVDGGNEAGTWSHTHSGGSVSGTTGAPSATFNSATVDVNVAFPTTTHTHSFSGAVTVGANSTFRPFALVGTQQFPDTES